MDILTVGYKNTVAFILDLLMEDFVTIAKRDPLDIPIGIPLIDAESETTEKSTDEEFERRVIQN
jgi:hypothetical protein